MPGAKGVADPPRSGNSLRGKGKEPDRGTAADFVERQSTVGAAPDRHGTYQSIVTDRDGAEGQPG